MDVIDWLLAAEDPDGLWAASPSARRAVALVAEHGRCEHAGWNCEAENGSVRSSVDTTINVLDGLLEYERVTGGSADGRAARRSGEENLLERALDNFRRSGADPDPRMAEAVDVVRSKRQPDGRWLLDRVHPGRVHFHLEEPGSPSRWNTLRARRVLTWWEMR